MITTCPGELIKCQNTAAVVESRLTKFNVDDSGYLRETGKCHIPCPPLAYDSNKEKAFLLDIHKYPILCTIQPAFLLHKFENVIPLYVQELLLLRWLDFLLMKPKAHNTDGSSSRSTNSSSYHLGIWRRSSAEPFITADTKCDGDLAKQKKCKDFLRLVQKHVATKIRSLLQGCAKDEWDAREK